MGIVFPVFIRLDAFEESCRSQYVSSTSSLVMSYVESHMLSCIAGISVQDHFKQKDVDIKMGSQNASIHAMLNKRSTLANADDAV